MSCASALSKDVARLLQSLYNRKRHFLLLHFPPFENTEKHQLIRCLSMGLGYHDSDPAAKRTHSLCHPTAFGCKRTSRAYLHV